MSKQPVVILAYGEGGHKKEMSLLYKHIKESELKFISLGPSPLCSQVTHFKLGDVRHKENRLKSLLMAMLGLFRSTVITLKICHKYQVTGIVSTGPGMAIIPSIILRAMGKNVIFIETFCRFYTRSFTGKWMSKICSEFWVQNKDSLPSIKMQNIVDAYENPCHCRLIIF